MTIEKLEATREAVREVRVRLLQAANGVYDKRSFVFNRLLCADGDLDCAVQWLDSAIELESHRTGRCVEGCHLCAYAVKR